MAKMTIHRRMKLHVRGGETLTYIAGPFQSANDTVAPSRDPVPDQRPRNYRTARKRKQRIAKASRRINR